MTQRDTFLVAFGNVLQGNVVPGLQIRDSGVSISRWSMILGHPWFVVIGTNREDKENMYGQRDKPGDVNRFTDRWRVKDRKNR